MKIEQFLLVVNRRKSSILFVCRAILHKFMGGGYLKLSIYLLLQCCLFAWGIGDIHAETVQLPSNSTQSFIVTGIEDIHSFLERCPTNDPVYNLLKQDFEILIDGQPITPIICNEPISAMPIDQYTDELITLQTLRTAYYMSIGTEGKLPWTQKDLYSWMASNISGVNIKTSPGQLYCCDYLNGKYYFSESRQDNYNRDIKRTWPGIAITLDYFAHEIRHSDAGAPGHTFGCIAFPLQTGFWGCDATYDLNNLGSYGVQYWLESSWATGYLNIGISCAPNDTAYQYATWNAACANGFRDRFVNNVPPIIIATQPYGGPCVSAETMTVPTGWDSYVYNPIVHPVVSIDPSQAKPVGVGSVAEGGDTLSIHVALSEFSGPVDVYFALSAPDINPHNIYILKSDNTFQLLAAGLEPWKGNTTGHIDEPLFGDIPTSLLPAGTYYLFLAVTPSHSFNTFYLWTTHFTISHSSACNYMPHSLGSSWTYNGKGSFHGIETHEITESSGNNIITTVTLSKDPGAITKIYETISNGVMLQTKIEASGPDYFTTLTDDPPVPSLPICLTEDASQSPSTTATSTITMGGDTSTCILEGHYIQRVIGRESVSVPAGTFPDALKIEYISTVTVVSCTGGGTGGGGPVHDYYWYVNKVGWVKMEAADGSYGNELTNYTIK